MNLPGCLIQNSRFHCPIQNPQQVSRTVGLPYTADYLAVPVNYRDLGEKKEDTSTGESEAVLDLILDKRIDPFEPSGVLRRSSGM